MLQLRHTVNHLIFLYNQTMTDWGPINDILCHIDISEIGVKLVDH
jgi:hypothetical protein